MEEREGSPNMLLQQGRERWGREGGGARQHAAPGIPLHPHMPCCHAPGSSPMHAHKRFLSPSAQHPHALCGDGHVARLQAALKGGGDGPHYECGDTWRNSAEVHPQ